MKKKFCIISVLLFTGAMAQCQQLVGEGIKKQYSMASIYSYGLQTLPGSSTHIIKTSKKIIVIAFLSPECPLSKNYAPALTALEKKYREQVQFTALIPGKFTKNELMQFQQDYIPAWQMLTDKSLLLTHYLQGKVTPEVLVINNLTGALIYKGAIDDWAVSPGRSRAKASDAYLDNSLNDALAGKAVLISYHKPVGCFINDY